MNDIPIDTPPSDIARAAPDTSYIAMLRSENKKLRRRAQDAEAEVKRLRDELARRQEGA